MSKIDTERGTHWGKELNKCFGGTDAVNIMNLFKSPSELNFVASHPTRNEGLGATDWSGTVLQAFILFALVTMRSLVISLGGLQLLPCCWQLILLLIYLQTHQTYAERRAKLCIRPSQCDKTKYRMSERLQRQRMERVMAYLGLKVLHGFLKGFGRRSLVVTEDGHRPVGSVIWEDFGWNAVISYGANKKQKHFQMTVIWKADQIVQQLCI